MGMVGTLFHTHPDRSKVDSERFKEVSEAYTSLTQRHGRWATPHRPMTHEEALRRAQHAAALSRSGVRNVGNTLLFCAASLLAGCGLFAGALLMGRTDMYRDTYGHRRLPVMEPGQDRSTHQAGIIRMLKQLKATGKQAEE
eukprot:jgi/Mesvir1/25036/Mv16975-RA.1